MLIGLPKEIKSEEYRVGLTPATAKEYVRQSHRVLVQSGAGVGSGFSDAEYAGAGCEVIAAARDVYAQAEMIVKVKEPIESEYELLRPGLILFTYLHLAADLPLTQALLNHKITGVAYETITDAAGHLPLLTPMSQIAGRMAVQEGAKYLERPFGGRGVLLSGVPGIQKGNILILGGGIAGTNACRIAVGLGANVTIMDISARRLTELEDLFGRNVQTLYSNRHNLEQELPKADLVICAVLIPGAATPKLITRQDLKLMKQGAVIVDISIDQGGCLETARATTHLDPVFIVDGVVHYCVANMPGALAQTSTLALTSVTNQYGLLIARGGVEAIRDNPALRAGLNTHDGHITNKAVAQAHGLAYHEPA